MVMMMSMTMMNLSHIILTLYGKSCSTGRAVCFLSCGNGIAWTGRLFEKGQSTLSF